MLSPATIRKVPLAYLLLLLLVAFTDARILPKWSKQVKVYSYVLPAGAEEIRDDINHSFACANRSDGFYVDIDNDCQIFHRCQDQARFSFICAERTVFSQMYQTCVHDGQLGYPCEESVQYYPEGENYEPSGAGSEPTGEEAQPEAAQPEAAQGPPEEEQFASQPQPSKSSELVMAPMEGTSDSESTNEVEPSQDNTQLAADQTGMKVEETKDATETQQQNEGNNHQVNADLFDSIEEESDVPLENSAQEVLDEAEPVVVSSVDTPAEAVSADATSQEDTQEVEVMDESTHQQQEQQHHQDVQQSQEEADFDATSDSSSASSVAPQDATEDVNGNPSLSMGLEVPEGTAAISEDLFTHGVHGEEYAGDALLNAVQTVEELEPIVHDLFVEHADASDVQPQVAEMAQDPSPAKVDAMEEGGNEVLPELDNALADMAAAPLAQITTDDERNEGEEDVGVETLLPEGAVESDQQVNELSAEPEAAVVADTADDSSEAIVSSAADAIDSDKPEQLASGEPEVADVKAESIDDEQEEANSFPLPENHPAADDLQPSPEVVAAEQSRPLESPAIVEEMAPLRPNDSAELPELIVSTEFHLDAATQGPAIRRRKTFLFRADAVRSRQ